MPRHRALLIKTVCGLLGAGLVMGLFPTRPVTASCPTTTAPTLRRLAFIGDSLTNPNLSIDPKLPAAVKLLKPWYYSSDMHAVPGDSTTACGARFEAGVRNASPAYDWMVVLCGINDINLGGDSGETVWARVEAFVTHRKNQGLKSLILYVPPFGNAAGWTSDKETRRDAYNAAAQTYCDSFPTLVFCLDINATMADSENPDALKAEYAHDDQLHWSQAGTDAVAAAVAAAIPTQ